MPLEIREAGRDDCFQVAELAGRTFTDTFGHLYRPENLLHHILHKCSATYFSESLARGDTILLLEQDAKLIGYAKVGTVDLPIKPPIMRGAEEIHRVYVEKPYQGSGFGKQLMIHILSLPRIANAPVVYLGVWEENLRAQQMYRQFGFEVAGKYLYQVGDQVDQELIMARRK